MEITGQENLKQLVEQSGAILITSHISPDPDAISSVLLLSETLRANFKDKKIVAVMEEKPSQDLAFLQGYRNISFQLIEKAVRSELPQLLIIVDANSFKRVSRESGEEIRTLEQVQVFGELINNLISDKGFNYSFINDAFMAEWQNQSKSMDEFHGGIDMFVNNYIRNVEPNTWGFIVYKDPMFERPTYHISFRAQNGSQDVSAVARGLGGGGHKPAAGAVIEAPSLQEAISKIKAAIEKTANS
jgi:nanoRNase/pAp phosphatase (c-di-AMP/oligoRNAs hydrolase)